MTLDKNSRIIVNGTNPENDHKETWIYTSDEFIQAYTRAVGLNYSSITIEETSVVNTITIPINENLPF